MHTAITELAVVEADLLGTLAGQLLDVGHAFALFLVLNDLAHQRLGYIAVHVQELVEMPLDDVGDVSAYGHLALLVHVVGRELCLGLAFKLRLVDFNRQ